MFQSSLSLIKKHVWVNVYNKNYKVCIDNTKLLFWTLIKKKIILVIVIQVLKINKYDELINLFIFCCWRERKNY